MTRPYCERESAEVSSDKYVHNETRCAQCFNEFVERSAVSIEIRSGRSRAASTKMSIACGRASSRRGSGLLPDHVLRVPVVLVADESIISLSTMIRWFTLTVNGFV